MVRQGKPGASRRAALRGDQGGRQRFHAWLLTRLAQGEGKGNELIAAKRQSLEAAKAKTSRELENLTRIRLRDLLTDEEFSRERERLFREQLGADELLNQIDRSNGWFEPAESLLAFGNSVATRFRNADRSTKRLILGIVGSNPSLKGKKLCIQPKKPFRVFSEMVSSSQLLAYVEDVRTFASDPTSLDTLEKIKKVLAGPNPEESLQVA